MPYIVAFSMFGAVGAMIVSRDRRNAVGLLLLWGCFTTAMSFTAGELADVARRARGHGLSRPSFWGSCRASAGCSGSFRSSSSCRCCSPTGTFRRPAGSRSSGGSSGCMFVLSIAMTIGSPTVSTLERRDRARQPVLPRGSRRIRDPRRVLRGPVLRDVGHFRRVRVRPLPAVAGASNANRSSGSRSGCSQPSSRSSSPTSWTTRRCPRSSAAWGSSRSRSRSGSRSCASTCTTSTSS